jgi:hypothetical protein
VMRQEKISMEFMVRELFQGDVAQDKLCKPLKIAPIRFGNFGEALDCMQVAARCMFGEKKKKSCYPRVKLEWL